MALICAKREGGAGRQAAETAKRRRPKRRRVSRVCLVVSSICAFSRYGKT